LLHVLPSGFQRIRHYGFLANRCRLAKLAHCRQLLAAPAPGHQTPRCLVRLSRPLRTTYREIATELPEVSSGSHALHRNFSTWYSAA
jgi:hypothetical protein